VSVERTYEVWARMVWAAIDVLDRAGLDTRRLYDGLPFDAVSLRKMRRVDWAHYCVIVERFEALAGGPEGCEALLNESYHASFPEVQALARAFVPPKELVRVLIGAFNPILFPFMVHRFEILAGDRVRITHMLPSDARPCLAWFRGSAGAARGMPRHLGLPSAELLRADVGPSHGHYELRLPPSRTLAARARRVAIRIVLGYDDDGTPLTASYAGGDAPLEITQRLDAAKDAWDLTPRQLDVLQYLARGEANKEIAQKLSCAENTVELHVTHLLRKSGASSRAQVIARFWSEL
jgi:DNA-binding CsgD family transcriptional regulator